MWAAKVNDKDCKCHGNILPLITSLNCLFSGEMIAQPASFSIVFSNQRRDKLYIQDQKYTYNHLHNIFTGAKSSKTSFNLQGQNLIMSSYYD